MKTKLTLSIEPQIIQIAKEYADLHKMSVSSLFEKFAQTLTFSKKTEELIADKYFGVLSKSKYASMTDAELKAERYESKYGY